MTPTIETTRLILRPLTIEDAPSMFEYTSNPEVTKYVLWDAHQTIDDTISFIQNYALIKYQDQQTDPLGICLKNDLGKLKAGTVIGTVGCFWTPGNGKHNKRMELGYALSPEAWGHGIMAEAANAVILWTFKNMDVVRVQAHVKDENLQSVRVLEKIGMSYEGTLKKAYFSKGKHWDMKLFAVTN